MLLAKNSLNHKEYLEAKSSGVTTFLYNKINFTITADENETFFNCNSERIKASWFLWEKNDQLIQLFKTKFPHLFQIGPYDLTLAIQKSLYWATIKQGQLHYSVSEKFKNHKTHQVEKLYHYKRLRSLARYLLLLFKGEKYDRPTRSVEKEKTSAIFLKDNFEVEIYDKIIEKVISDPGFVIYVNNLRELSPYSKGKTAPENVFKSKEGSLFKIPFINPLKFIKEEWFVFNQILLTWQEISTWIVKAEQIADSKVSNVLINEGENGVFGAMFCEVMKRFGVKTYNTMNGIKAGLAQEAFINFDKWFIWDEKMQNLLIQKCNLAQDLFIISGHLGEDIIAEYNFKNTIGISPESVVDKKVISLVSVLGKLEEKTEVFSHLYKLAKEDPNLVLIIRFHPNEEEADKIYPEFNSHKNIHFIKYDSGNNKDTLFDQLILSDLCIVFGSTVALESKWFNVPCISFEKREVSWVYLTDNKYVYHSKTLSEFQNTMETILKTELSISREKINKNKVVSTILEHLNSNT